MNFLTLLCGRITISCATLALLGFMLLEVIFRAVYTSRLFLLHYSKLPGWVARLEEGTKNIHMA